MRQYKSNRLLRKLTLGTSILTTVQSVRMINFARSCFGKASLDQAAFITDPCSKLITQS